MGIVATAALVAGGASHIAARRAALLGPASGVQSIRRLTRERALL